MTADTDTRSTDLDVPAETGKHRAPGRGLPRRHFHPHGWLDRVFAVAIVLKGLDGLLELVGGVLLLLVTPAQISGVAALLTRGELAEEPHDLIANAIVHAAGGITGAGMLFAAVYLLAHGVIKIVLVAALLLDRLWAYPWMIVALLGFIGYQCWQLVGNPTAGLAALTIFDVVVVALTLREWRVRRRLTEPYRGV